MSSEYRVVFFEDREVVMALIDHARTQGTKLPAGTAAKLQIDRATMTAKLSFAKRGSAPEPPVEFHSAALAQAMIRHCKKVGIPLPVRANKELRVMDDRVAFVVELVREPTETTIPIEYQ
jgi:hypothetical protein